MIRDSRARDVYAIIDDVTTPYEPLYVIVSVIVGFRNLSNAFLFDIFQYNMATVAYHHIEHWEVWFVYAWGSFLTKWMGLRLLLHTHGKFNK